MELTAISAICEDIRDIYSLDLKTEAVTAIRQSGHALNVGGPGMEDSRYEEVMRSYISNNVLIRDRDQFLHTMRLQNILDAIEKEGSLSVFYRVYRNGELQYFRLKCVPVRENGDITKLIFAFIPESFRTRQSELIRLIEMDDVTNLYNKQAFYQHASELLAEDPDGDYDVIITDVVGFKLVNQIYGRSGGDSVLKYLAERFEAAARGGICARYGADRFVILSKAMSDQENQMFGLLAKKLTAESPVPNLSIHYGIHRKVSRDDSVAEMCDKAMLALRSIDSRETGIAFYDREMMEMHYRSLMYENDFERALAAGEFVVYVQPKYNTFTRRISSGEALVRWRRSDGTMISPKEFIPVFESDGLIARLDEYVFRFVCDRQKKLLEAGVQLLPISVNMSRATFFGQETVAVYSRIIDEAGIDKKYVPIEVTESAAMDTERAGLLVKTFSEAGFVLQMDDFGSGYSSLSSLATLQFNALKLDRSLIHSIGMGRGEEILRHIIELAHFAQMEVVAEGVETNDQYLFLKKLSCDTIQGYFFSKTISFEDFTKLCLSQPVEQSELLESAALAEEASVGSLRITNDTRMQYFSAMARIYMTIHVIDLKEDTVVEFATTTNVKEHVNRVHDCAGQMRAAMTATVAPEYLEAVLRFTDLATIASRMRGKKTITEDFVGKHFGWFRARFITVTADENEEPEKLIYTTEVIEADRRKENDLIRVCRTDELTGVNNSAAFADDILEIPLTPELHIMSADIFGLGKINATAGRFAGDEVISGTAMILKKVFGKDSIIYRLGGDEFAAVFRSRREEVEDLRSDFETAVHNWMGNEVRSLRTSYGIASSAEFPELTLEQLLQKAELRRREYRLNMSEPE